MSCSVTKRVVAQLDLLSRSERLWVWRAGLEPSPWEIHEKADEQKDRSIVPLVRVAQSVRQTITKVGVVRMHDHVPRY